MVIVKKMLVMLLVLFCFNAFNYKTVLAKEANLDKQNKYLVSYEKTAIISKETLKDWIKNGLTFLNTINAKESDFLEPKSDVVIYRIVYNTHNPDKEDILEQVSGLLAVPLKSQKALPMLSYQHSTEFTRTFVPSNIDKSVEAQMVLATFATQGYAVVIADYIGKGVSKVMHPYFLAKSEAQASYDLILALRELLPKEKIDISKKIFLMGWSQGGHATMALQRLMEKNGEKITANASIAGGYDLCLLWQLWLTKKTSFFIPAVMANMLEAYAYYNKMPHLVKTAVRPKYQPVMEGMFDNDNFVMEDFNKYPEKVQDFLQVLFIEQMLSGQNLFYQKLQENEVYQWKPLGKICFYHGLADDIIPFETTKKAYDYLQKTGADVTLKQTGENSDHRDCFLQSLTDAYVWFESL